MEKSVASFSGFGRGFHAVQTTNIDNLKYANVLQAKVQILHSPP